MNFQQRGAVLINQLKELVIEVLQTHPEAGPGNQGISQRELARRAGLHSIGTVELDHTAHEMLRLLHKEGKVEPAEEAGQPAEEVRWRLKE